MTNVASDIGQVEPTLGVGRGDDGSSPGVCRQARWVEPGTLGRALDDLGDRLPIDEPTTVLVNTGEIGLP